MSEIRAARGNALRQCRSRHRRRRTFRTPPAGSRRSRQSHRAVECCFTRLPRTLHVGIDAPFATAECRRDRPTARRAAGNAVPTEQGQADGNVLMAQNGSLVYYALQVNDVFAYFLTGQKGGQISATTFPTTPASLNSIEAFALTHNKTFPDANALAIELKSAWIEATGLDTSKYATMTATIPKYDQVSPTQWNANGTRQAQLAMVGIHVVGSAAGHPEMIWATFEHVNNTRDTQYSYTDNASPGVNRSERRRASELSDIGHDSSPRSNSSARSRMT